MLLLLLLLLLLRPPRLVVCTKRVCRSSTSTMVQTTGLAPHTGRALTVNVRRWRRPQLPQRQQQQQQQK